MRLKLWNDGLVFGFASLSSIEYWICWAVGFLGVCMTTRKCAMSIRGQLCIVYAMCHATCIMFLRWFLCAQVASLDRKSGFCVAVICEWREVIIIRTHNLCLNKTRSVLCTMYIVVSMVHTTYQLCALYSLLFNPGHGKWDSCEK